MKRTLASFLVLLFVFCMFGTAVFADDSTVTAYVTISDDTGTLVLARQAVRVSDADGDGAITISDALFAAHEAKFVGGAAAGYRAEESAYGLSLLRLWGIENGGSYGYYVNNASPMSLSDPIQQGDHISAYAYSDLIAWSDTFSYFDVDTAAAAVGEAFTLTLSAAGYDAAWNPVVLPVSGAAITVNGEATEFVTDADGKVTLTLDTAGTAVISATSETMTLVPPVCVVSVTDPDIPYTADTANTALSAALCLLSLAGLAILGVKRNHYEK